MDDEHRGAGGDRGPTGREQRLAQFMAGVSHDLKTPLNSVIGFTSVLLQGAEGLGPDQLRQLRLVAQSANRLLGRLDALVELFRLRAGIIVPRTDWFAPGPVLERVIERADRAEGSTGPVEGAVPARIRTDARLLERAVGELVDNGDIHGGGVTRLVCACAPDARRDRVRLSVAVHDQGPGLTPDRAEALARALGPMFLAGEGARKDDQGLGLGLALAREAAGLLGGWIEMDNRPERGCTFSLVLELEPGDVEA